MKKYTLIIIPLLLLSLFSPISATYLNPPIYSSDSLLYRSWDNYVDPDSLVNMFVRIGQDLPNWYSEYDYVVSYSTSTQTRIRLIRKNDPRIRYFLAKINDDSSADIDSWRLIIESTGTVQYKLYTFTTVGGAYVSLSNITSATDVAMTNEMYYTNFNAYVHSGYYAGSTAALNLIEFTNFDKRTLPTYVLVNSGQMTQATSDVINNANQNTDKILSFWQKLSLTAVRPFLSETEWNQYREDLLEGNAETLLDVVDETNVFQIVAKMLKSVADAVIGVTYFWFRLLDSLRLLIAELILSLGNIVVKTAITLSTLNNKILQTPTILQPIYQATFTIFPAIMGLSVIKFFIKIFTGGQS